MALLGKKKLFVFLFDRPTRMLAGPLGAKHKHPISRAVVSLSHATWGKALASCASGLDTRLTDDYLLCFQMVHPHPPR